VKVIENALSDRGSKYAVSGGAVGSAEEAKAFVKSLTRRNGMVILRMLEREGLNGHIIVVTRWFGGTKLGGDRFRRVQDAVRVYLDEFESNMPRT